jgi:hypothetical protein
MSEYCLISRLSTRTGLFLNDVRFVADKGLYWIVIVINHLHNYLQVDRSYQWHAVSCFLCVLRIILLKVHQWHAVSCFLCVLRIIVLKVHQWHFSYIGVVLSVVESGVHKENTTPRVIDEPLAQWSGVHRENTTPRVIKSHNKD